MTWTLRSAGDDFAGPCIIDCGGRGPVRGLRVLTLALAALLLAGPAGAQRQEVPPLGANLPGVGGSSRRVAVDAGQAPWSSLVRVQAPGLTRCTGVLLAPDRVATAAHCLYSLRLGRFIPPDAVHVLLGYGHGAYAGHAASACDLGTGTGGSGARSRTGLASAK